MRAAQAKQCGMALIRWVGVLAAAAVVASVVRGCLMLHRVIGEEPVDVERITWLTGIEFPPGTVVVDGSYEKLVRAHLWAKLEVGSSQVQSFMRDLADDWSTGEPPSEPYFRSKGLWEEPTGPGRVHHAFVNQSSLARSHQERYVQHLQVIEVVVVEPERGPAPASILSTSD